MQHKFLYEVEGDFPDYCGKPAKVICLHFIPRSGSNLLSDLMRQTGVLGYPLEYFSPGNISSLTERIPSFDVRHLDPLLRKRTSSNGVFSFKWNSGFERRKYGAKLRTTLAPKYHLYIDRLDYAAQARSFCIAQKTSVWVQLKDKIKKDAAYIPSEDEIKSATQELAGVRVATKQLLQKIAPQYLELTSEELFSNPAGVMTRVLQHCEVECSIKEMPTKAVFTAPS